MLAKWSLVNENLRASRYASEEHEGGGATGYVSGGFIPVTPGKLSMQVALVNVESLVLPESYTNVDLDALKSGSVVRTGNGGDTVKIASGTNLVLSLGGGNDRLELGSSVSASSIALGSGDDYASVFVGNSIVVGAGKNTVHLQALSAELKSSAPHTIVSGDVDNFNFGNKLVLDYNASSIILEAFKSGVLGLHFTINQFSEVVFDFKAVYEKGYVSPSAGRIDVGQAATALTTLADSFGKNGYPAKISYDLQSFALSRPAGAGAYTYFTSDPAGFSIYGSKYNENYESHSSKDFINTGGGRDAMYSEGGGGTVVHVGYALSYSSFVYNVFSHSFKSKDALLISNTSLTSRSFVSGRDAVIVATSGKLLPHERGGIVQDGLVLRPFDVQAKHTLISVDLLGEAYGSNQVRIEFYSSDGAVAYTHQEESDSGLRSLAFVLDWGDLDSHLERLTYKLFAKIDGVDKQTSSFSFSSSGEVKNMVVLKDYYSESFGFSVLGDPYNPGYFSERYGYWYRDGVDSRFNLQIRERGTLESARSILFSGSLTFSDLASARPYFSGDSAFEQIESRFKGVKVKNVLLGDLSGDHLSDLVIVHESFEGAVFTVYIRSAESGELKLSTASSSPVHFASNLPLGHAEFGSGGVEYAIYSMGAAGQFLHLKNIDVYRDFGGILGKHRVGYKNYSIFFDQSGAIEEVRGVEVWGDGPKPVAFVVYNFFGDQTLNELHYVNNKANVLDLFLVGYNKLRETGLDRPDESTAAQYDVILQYRRDSSGWYKQAKNWAEKDFTTGGVDVLETFVTQSSVSDIWNFSTYVFDANGDGKDDIVLGKKGNAFLYDKEYVMISTDSQGRVQAGFYYPDPDGVEFTRSLMQENLGGFQVL